jgi:hypothetical protein
MYLNKKKVKEKCSLVGFKDGLGIFSHQEFPSCQLD